MNHYRPLLFSRKTGFSMIRVALLFSCLLFCLCFHRATAQLADTAMIGMIKRLGPQHDPARQIAGFCRLAGSRLNGSDGYARAVKILTDSLARYGFSDVHTEPFPASFKNWKLTDFKATVVSPDVYPLAALPRAYTCGTNGPIRGELIFPGTFNLEKLKQFSGKLKGKIVLIDSPLARELDFKPLASRLHDTTLQRMADQPVPGPDEIAARKEKEKAFEGKLMKYFTRQAEIIAFMEQEGAAALIFGGRQPYGIVQSMNAFTSEPPQKPLDAFFYAAFEGHPVGLPQITISEDQYHDLVMRLRSGHTAEMELEIGVTEEPGLPGMSLFAEIPGGELKEEVVMIGAHLDAYPAGQGATDNAAGVFTCIEALRILKEAGLKPRRTIRLALWGSEEMADFLGSGTYVKEHFTGRHDEKLVAYFNSDNGAGAFRGIYAQESAEAKSLFDSWIPLIGEPRFQTIAAEFTGDTDHMSFQEAGLPGYQFIQDPLNYRSIFHTNLDIPVMIPSEDVQYNAMVLAIVAWLASETAGEFTR